MDQPTQSRREREKPKIPEDLQLAETLANLGNIAVSIYFFFSYQGPVNWLGLLGLAAPLSFLLCIAGFAGLIHGVILLVYRFSPHYREWRAGQARAGAGLEVDAAEYDAAPKGQRVKQAEALEGTLSDRPVAAAESQRTESSPFKWRVVRILGLATFFGAIIIPSVSGFIDAPPFRWMSQLQMALFHGYSAFASWLLAAFAWGAIGLVLLWILDPMGILATGPRPGKKSQPSDAGAASMPRRFGGTVAVGMIGGLCLLLLAGGTGFYSLIQGDLISTTVAELQAGRKPGSHWLEVEGIALPGKRVAVGEKTIVVPLVTRGWETAEEVDVFLRMDQKTYDHKIWRAGPGKYQGLVSMFDVGGEARSAFSHDRQLKAGPHSFVIDLDETPAFWGDFSRLMWGLTAAFFAVAGIFRLVGLALPPIKAQGP